MCYTIKKVDGKTLHYSKGNKDYSAPVSGAVKTFLQYQTMPLLAELEWENVTGNKTIVKVNIKGKTAREKKEFVDPVLVSMCFKLAAQQQIREHAVLSNPDVIGRIQNDTMLLVKALNELLS